MLRRSSLRSFIELLVAGAIAGGSLPGSPIRNADAGVVAGGSICAALIGLEDLRYGATPAGYFRHLPFLPYFALRSVLYVGVIFVIIALVDWPSGQFLAVDSVDSLILADAGPWDSSCSA